MIADERKGVVFSCEEVLSRLAQRRLIGTGLHGMWASILRRIRNCHDETFDGLGAWGFGVRRRSRNAGLPISRSTSRAMTTAQDISTFAITGTSSSAKFKCFDG